MSGPGGPRSGRSRLRPGDGIAVEAAEAGAATALRRAVASQSIEALHKPADGDRSLHARQHGAQAHVDSRAEGEVAVGLAARIEAVGLGELCRVAVGGADADMDVGAA